MAKEDYIVSRNISKLEIMVNVNIKGVNNFKRFIRFCIVLMPTTKNIAKFYAKLFLLAFSIPLPKHLLRKSL